MRFLSVAMAGLFLGLLTYAPAFANTQPAIMGWVEYVTIDGLDTKLKAKLDSGATTSSMRAEIIKIVRPAQHKDAKKKKPRRVIFQVESDDGQISTIERNLVRWVRIKDKSGGLQRRPVVEMDFCVAGRRVHAEVNLASRKDFVYPILVGRNMLREGHILVDSNRTFTARARCMEPAKKRSAQD